MSSSDDDMPLAELTPLARLAAKRPDIDFDSDISVDEDNGSDYRPTDSDNDSDSDDNDQPGPSTSTSTSRGRGVSVDSDSPQWRTEFFQTETRVCRAVSGPPRPMRNIEDAFGFFSLMWPVELYQLMAEQTNLYARQRLVASGLAEDRIGQVFQPTTVDEIRAYIGLLLFMSVLRAPSKLMYWDKDSPTYNPWVDSVMSASRFQLLARFFHLADAEQAVGRDQPGFDPLYKVRPLISATQESFFDGFYPGQNLTVDEAMVKFKGRCQFRQYLPSKPCKYGLKVWALCDADSFYMCRYSVYTGKRNDLPAVESSIPQGEQVVRHLVEPYLHRWHTVYMDNFFSSVSLYKFLFARGTSACGTVRQDRKGCPAELREKCVRKSGECRQWFSSLGDGDDQGCLQCLAWFDNRKVCFLSSAHDDSQGVVVRKAGHGKPQKSYARPKVAADYNLNYNGVDKHDQLRSAYGCKLRFHKWWKYLFFFCLDTAAVNAYIIHKHALVHPLSHRDFQMQLIMGMVAGFKGRKRPRVSSPLPGSSLAEHTPSKIHTARGKRNCVLCTKEGRKTTAGKPIQSTYQCVPCGVALCKDRGCFGQFHLR